MRSKVFLRIIPVKLNQETDESRWILSSIRRNMLNLQHSLQLWIGLSTSLFYNKCTHLKTVNSWVQEGRQSRLCQWVNLWPDDLGSFPYSDAPAQSYQRESIIDFMSRIMGVAVKQPWSAVLGFVCSHIRYRKPFVGLICEIP